jgi:creatinine amidohydrolase
MIGLSACDEGALQERPTTMQGVRLGALTWEQAERVLTQEAVVVLPVGAAAKEHGPHLPLDNDWRIAAYFADRVLEQTNVVMAPGLRYHHYPAFGEYPGSTSLKLETARDLTVDVIRSLAAHGPRRFYVLNTGVSTNRALEPAAELLAADGIVMTYTDLKRVHERVSHLLQQPGGSHADEKETSMMLVIAPQVVNMRAAVKDYDPRPLPGMTRKGPNEGKTYSPTGVWGDPTLATVAKGEVIVAAQLALILEDIAALRRRKLP